MKEFFCVLLLIILAGASDPKLVHFEDKAYGSKGWRVVDIPKTRDHEHYIGAAQWKMQPVILEPISGSPKIYMQVKISAATDSSMPDAVDLRVDDTTVTVSPLRETSDDLWVNEHNFGTLSVEFSVQDRSLIERIEKSKDAWIIGYTRYGNHLRRSVEIPGSWKQALRLILAKYDQIMATKTMGEPAKSTSE